MMVLPVLMILAWLRDTDSWSICRSDFDERPMIMVGWFEVELPAEVDAVDDDEAGLLGDRLLGSSAYDRDDGLVLGLFVARHRFDHSG